MPGLPALFWERDKKKTKQGTTLSTLKPQFVRSLALSQHCFGAESLATDPLTIFSALQVWLNEDFHDSVQAQSEDIKRWRLIAYQPFVPTVTSHTVKVFVSFLLWVCLATASTIVLPFATIKVSALASALPYTLYHTSSAKLNWSHFKVFFSPTFGSFLHLLQSFSVLLRDGQTPRQGIPLLSPTLNLISNNSAT